MIKSPSFDFGVYGMNLEKSMGGAWMSFESEPRHIGTIRAAKATTLAFLAFMDLSVPKLVKRKAANCALHATPIWPIVEIPW